MDDIRIINGLVQFLCEEVGQPEGFDFPTSRNVYIDPPNRGGTLDISSLPGRRNLSWRGLIKTNVAENRRLLAQACAHGPRKTIKWTTCDGIELQTEVRIDSLINPVTNGMSPYLITATAPDFRFLSQTLHSQNISISTSKGGTPIPAAIPAPIPGTGTSFANVFNAGNAESEPLFTIRGPGKNFTIFNKTTGQKIYIEINLAANETVTINTQTNEVFKGNQNSFGLVTRTPTGKWLHLAPGNNQIYFDAESLSNANTLLTILWNDAYLNGQ